MTTLKSPKLTAKKTLAKYTRISLNKKLQSTIAQIQLQLPLFTVNDSINFLISKGYQQWLNEQQTNVNNQLETEHNPNFANPDTYKWLDDESQNIYSLNDGEALKN